MSLITRVNLRDQDFDGEIPRSARDDNAIKSKRLRNQPGLLAFV